METAIPVEKNKEYEINIESLGINGEGVGRIQGFTPALIIQCSIRYKILWEFEQEQILWHNAFQNIVVSENVEN